MHRRKGLRRLPKDEFGYIIGILHFKRDFIGCL